MGISRFEDIVAWQKAQDLAVEVYKLFRDSRDFGFKDQICRTAVSVSNNIAEGFERRSDADFARFLDIAKGSNGEVRSMLYLAEDRGYLTAEAASGMREFSERLSQGIESLSKHLRL